jgi:nucleotide-binding universal stress UspA family protein
LEGRERECVMNESADAVKIKSILVAVDGSEYSLKAVRYACAMGPPLGAEVVLLHVVPMLVSATPYHDTVSDQPFLALQKVGEDILARAKTIASDSNCEVIDMITHGDPASKIIDIASERGTDVIILGSRGLSGIRRLFVGSISDKVARNAHCPVMIVR